MPSIRLPAFAKINQQLLILGQRADGYHELRTIFQSVSLHDDLELETLRAPRVDLIVEGDELLAAERTQNNLVVRALELLRNQRGLRTGVRARLVKRIPAGRGLGGGSSDAAAALVGFARLARKDLPPSIAIAMGSTLGADVPFFLLGGRAIGIGRGDEIYPLPDVQQRSVLVVSPHDIAVRTADAYGWVRERAARPDNLAAVPHSEFKLTKTSMPPKLLRLCALAWSTRETETRNDFESAVFPRHPRLAEIKRALLESGAAEASLAGSGSAVFALFRSPAQARRAANGFPQDQIFICETLSRGEYQRAQRGRVSGFRSPDRRKI